MDVSKLYQPERLGLSFELFPPKSEAREKELFEHVRELMRFKPDFVTCTYGAGGSTRTKTLDIVERVKNDFRVPVASHLTCVGSTRDELRAYLAEAASRGVEAIVALRGDPPKGETSFKPVDGGLSYANELVELVRGEFPQFAVVVAAYPETHREAPSADADLVNLKRKVDAGADVMVTQLFYDNADFFRFRDRCDAAGLKTPLVPGILPITNLAQVQRITALCGAKLPQALCDKLSKYAADDAVGQFQAGVEYATTQVQELIDRSIPGLHFYVLNHSHAIRELLPNLRFPQGVACGGV